MRTEFYRRIFERKIIPILLENGITVDDSWVDRFDRAKSNIGIHIAGAYGELPIEVYAHIVLERSPLHVSSPVGRDMMIIHVFTAACSESVWPMTVDPDGHVVVNHFDFARLLRGDNR